METAEQYAQEYDYRQYDRVWKKVAPELNPYPEVRQMAETELPGAQRDPCCMGSNSLASEEVLEGFIREEQGAARTYQQLARSLPNMEARRLFAQLAREEEAHARKMAAAFYLMTGRKYDPAVQETALPRRGYCETLRAEYHEEACSGFNYARAAEEALDPCLKTMLMQFSEDEYRHARRISDLLAKTL